ncbi:MAG: TIGR03905 family TSCPD domain-containing protein [Spirochaetales bacterium]|nr:TIGR03905 family TSCPD domain-containing protein [Spirochaetales bacterium]
MEEIEYIPEGTCAVRIRIVLEDDRVKTLDFERGCPGNLLGLKALVEGMKKEDVITRLKGIDCHGKGTSCPDQLAIALSGRNDQDAEESEAC